VIFLPFDGIVVKSVVSELSGMLENGRIEKIYQPESDEIVLSIRAGGQNHRLVMSASPKSPRIHLSRSVKENPSSPPMFCMLLRKYLSGGRISKIEFHDYERIVTIHVESTDELGDKSTLRLIIEIMGRHSNIILVNPEGKIIDSIKHVDEETSSKREVMPARPYQLPPSQNKTSPEALDLSLLFDIKSKESKESVENFLLNNIKGFSPAVCKEIALMSGTESKTPVSELSDEMLDSVKKSLAYFLDLVKAGRFSPCISFEDSSRKKPLDFHCITLSQFKYIKTFFSTNEMLDVFYSQKDSLERLAQKKSHLIKLLSNSIDRVKKKISLHNETLREVADRETLKLYGELIIANLHAIAPGSKSARLLNYYSENGDYVDIPLDANITPQKNAQKYFKKYAKAKSAFSYANMELDKAKKELDYLESVLHALEECTSASEIEEIKQELSAEGYIHTVKKRSGKKDEQTSMPLYFRSSDGFDIYVGKNNRQNDLLTLKASPADIWLHTKDIPGSHVIIRTGKRPVTDKCLKEAAMLAAYHSRARISSNVAVDYTAVKNVRKPSGAKPGMVIYDNHKTIFVTPDRELVEKLTRN